MLDLLLPDYPGSPRRFAAVLTQISTAQERQQIQPPQFDPFVFQESLPRTGLSDFPAVTQQVLEE